MGKLQKTSQTAMQELAIELRKSVTKKEAAATTTGLSGVQEPRLGLPHGKPLGAAGRAAAVLPAVTSQPPDTQRDKSYPLSLQGTWQAGIPHLHVPGAEAEEAPALCSWIWLHTLLGSTRGLSGTRGRFPLGWRCQNQLGPARMAKAKP